MERISSTISSRSKNGGSAFIAYITAGDRTLSATSRYVKVLEQAGADIIELGVPFSDPVADGPTNQKAAERALKNGTTLKDILTCVKKLRLESVSVPIMIFTYYNPIHSYGLGKFAQEAKEAGVSGVLVVDLPPEEASDYLDAVNAFNLETVFLASPTTIESRLQLVDKSSSGFVYYVSRTGVTGTEASPSDEIGAQIKKIKEHLNQPVGVGFGISTPEMARAVADHADGVVVGSALVNIIAQEKPTEEIEKQLYQKARELAVAIHKEEPCL